MGGPELLWCLIWLGEIADRDMEIVFFSMACFQIKNIKLVDIEVGLNYLGDFTESEAESLVLRSWDVFPRPS